MRKFEYKMRANLGESDLNHYGNDGYELVAVSRDAKTGKHWFFLKREILK